MYRIPEEKKIRVIVDTIRSYLTRDDEGAVLNTFDDFDVHRKRQLEAQTEDDHGYPCLHPPNIWANYSPNLLTKWAIYDTINIGLPNETEIFQKSKK